MRAGARRRLSRSSEGGPAQAAFDATGVPHVAGNLPTTTPFNQRYDRGSRSWRRVVTYARPGAITLQTNDDNSLKLGASRISPAGAVAEPGTCSSP